MFSRAGRAALLDRDAFLEAFFDDDAMADGAIIVAIVGAGTYLGWVVLGTASFTIAALFSVLISSIISWLILGFATWFAAGRLFGASGRPQTLLALHGLAVLPLLLELAGQQIVAGVGLVWYLVVLVVGTKVGTDLATRNAAVSVLIGFALAALVRMLIRVPFAVFSGLFA